MPRKPIHYVSMRKESKGRMKPLPEPHPNLEEFVIYRTPFNWGKVTEKTPVKTFTIVTPSVIDSDLFSKQLTEAYGEIELWYGLTKDGWLVGLPKPYPWGDIMAVVKPIVNGLLYDG